MDALTVLDLLYDGHSCNDCEEQLSCHKEEGVCEMWGLASSETLLISLAGNEIKKSIDAMALHQIADWMKSNA